MDPTLQQIQELRHKFFQKIEEEVKDFHPKDITRVTSDDCWLRRFLLHHDLDMKDALNMLLETCEWRKTNKINEINEQTVNLEYLNEGSLFVHNRDKDGKSLFIFKCKKHVKGTKDFEELKKCVVYWLERLERQDKGDQMTIFFDMEATGLANMDMDYTKYLINLCKLYYPHFLNYILIFEMPWVLNAAFKIIKSWLPAKAVQKIKFVNKSTLKEYVDVDQALVCWGGSDNYEFVFVPEHDSSRSDENKKKVHFADGSPMLDNVQGSFGDVKQDEFYLSSSKLKITPSDAILFNMDGIEMSGTLTITNASDSTVTYKVKTTSPEKFRVRPSCGFLPPGGVSSIAVVLQANYTPANILRDKFLIMSFPVDPVTYSTNDLNDLWKNCDSKKVDQHRLKCAVSGVMSHNGSPTSNSPQMFHTPLAGSNEHELKTGKLLISVNQLHKKIESMENDLKQTKYMSWLTVLLVVMFGVAYFYIASKIQYSCSTETEITQDTPID